MVLRRKTLGPMQKITTSEVAVIIGVDKSTLERSIDKLSTGETLANTRNADVARMAPLFFAAESTKTDVTAAQVYATLGLPLPRDPKGMEYVPIALARTREVAVPKAGAKPARKRAKELKEEDLAELGTDQLRDLLTQKSTQTHGRVPGKAIELIMQALDKRGCSPQGKVRGYSLSEINAGTFARFGTFGNFLASAGPSDLWLCVLATEDSRPVDIFAATPKELRYGRLAALNVGEIARLLLAAIRLERKTLASQAEALEIGKAAPMPRKALSQAAAPATFAAKSGKNRPRAASLKDDLPRKVRGKRL